MSSMSCMNVPSLRGRHDRSNLMRRIGTLDNADEKDVHRYFLCAFTSLPLCVKYIG
jgi:hypothetical protein